MGLTGKYNFPGIKKQGAVGLRLLLASSPYTAWLLSFGSLSEVFLQALANFAANKGLIIMNIGSFYIEGTFQQEAFDQAMDSGWKTVENPDTILTPEKIKEIDDAVIKAADKFLPYGKPKSNPS